VPPVMTSKSKPPNDHRAAAEVPRGSGHPRDRLPEYLPKAIDLRRRERSGESRSPRRSSSDRSVMHLGCRARPHRLAFRPEPLRIGRRKGSVVGVRPPRTVERMSHRPRSG
jgi:hypothetical protein